MSTGCLDHGSPPQALVVPAGVRATETYCARTVLKYEESYVDWYLHRYLPGSVLSVLAKQKLRPGLPGSRIDKRRQTTATRTAKISFPEILGLAATLQLGARAEWELGPRGAPVPFDRCQLLPAEAKHHKNHSNTASHCSRCLIPTVTVAPLQSVRNGAGTISKWPWRPQHKHRRSQFLVGCTPRLPSQRREVRPDQHG